MIYESFVYFFNMSIMVSVVIALILVVRLFMGRFPKKYCYMLWGIVLLRILCPLEITSSVSVFNLIGDSWGRIGVYEQAAEGTPAASEREGQPGDQSLSEGQAKEPAPVPSMDLANDTTAVASDTTAIAPNTNSQAMHGTDADGKKQDNSEIYKEEHGDMAATQVSRFVKYGSFVWAFGVLGLFFWNVLLMVLMKWKVRTSVLLRDNIYECGDIPSPFVMGFVKPRIYIPFRLSGEEQDYIIEHERHHIARKDNFIKLVALVVLCLYWFCPLFWIAWFFMNRDMEMSCDEYVLQKSNKDIRADYSKSLLGFALNQRNMGIGMTPFGESDARKRVKHIMTLKKYKKRIGVAAVVLILIVGVICLTNAKQNEAKVEGDIVQESVEDETREGMTKSGKMLPAEDYKVAAVTTVYDYRVEIQCFSGEEDENYLSGDRVMIRTSRGEEVIDIYEVDFALDEACYFPKDGFDISLADYDGDGEKNDFVLGQGQTKEPLAGNFMKYLFFGIRKDGMITGYHVSNAGDGLSIITKPGDYSPVFRRKNGEVHYEGLSKTGVKKKAVSIVRLLTVDEAEAAGQQSMCPRMALIRNNMPAEVVEELEQHGVWRIIYGKTPDEIHCLLGNAEHSEEITLRLDFYYEGNRLTGYVSKPYGFTANNVKTARGDEKQTAFRFARDFTGFEGKDDDMMTEAKLPIKWEGVDYKYYEDMRGATYLIDSRINMVIEYSYPEESVSHIVVPNEQKQK